LPYGKNCSVTPAVSGTNAPAVVSRVTADPRRSWNVSPMMPAFAQSLPHDVRNPLVRHNYKTALAGPGKYLPQGLADPCDGGSGL
jgi:hypothetical protein